MDKLWRGHGYTEKTNFLRLNEWRYSLMKYFFSDLLDTYIDKIKDLIIPIILCYISQCVNQQLSLKRRKSQNKQEKRSKCLNGSF